MAGSVIGALRVNLGLDSAEFTRGTRNAESAMQKLSAKMAVVGAAIGAAMGAIIKSSVEGAIAQRQAVAQVESALASMGDAVGRTRDQLIAASDAMELRSLYDGDVILKQVTANLLTFGNIAGEQFDRAQQAAIDMATRLGGEPQSAAIMLGKALNDPIKGITALTRVGVQFTDQQREQIAAMTEAGNAAGAQAIILAEVERQFKGAAAAAADADPYRVFNVTLGQIGDTIGEALLPTMFELRDMLARNREGIVAAAQGFVEFGGTLARTVQALSPLIGGFAAYRVALLAANGAMLIFNSSIVAVAGRVGVLTTAQLLAARATNTLTAALVRNPFTAVAVAVGALAATFISLANAQRQARAETDNLIRSLKAAAQARSADFALRRVEASTARNKQQDAASEAEANRNALLRGAGVDPRRYEAGNLTKLEKDRLRGLSDALKRANSELATARLTVIQLDAEIEMADEAFQKAGQAASQIEVPAAQSATAISGLGGSIREAGASARVASDEFGDLFERLFPESITRRQVADLALIEKYKDRFYDVGKARLRALGIDEKAKVSEGLLNTGPLVDLKKSADDFLEEQRRMAEETKTNTVTIAQSFAQMSQRITSSLQGLANSIRSGDFLGILGGVLDIFTQLGSAGAFGKGLQTRLNTPPSFAGGGFTGMGSRTGGLDGKGGFLAMLHPRESVIDHTKGQGMGGRVHVTVGVDPRNGNIVPFVNGQIAQSAPLIANAGAQQAQALSARSASRRVR